MKQFCCSFLIVLLLAACASAYQLTWYDDVDYPAGSTGPVDFTDVDGSGVTMTFEWVDITGTFFDNLPDDDAVKDQMPPLESGLWYALNEAQRASLVISFSEPVTNVSFNVWDIDGVQATPPTGPDDAMEYLRIKSFLAGGNVLPTDAGGGNHIMVDWGLSDPAVGVILYNDGLFDVWPPHADSMGWVTMDGPIDKVGMQFIARDVDRGQILGDVTFVPEPATVVMLMLGGLLIRRKTR